MREVLDLNQSGFRLERMTARDWPGVREILSEGIATGHATFETEAPSWTAWDREHLKETRIVARLHGKVIGWAALSPVSERCVYGGVAEVSAYVSAAFRNQGVGRALLQELVARSEASGIWTLQAGVFPENEASLALHVSCGFREVGLRERIGRLNGIWRDVVLLERRSPLF